MIILMILSLLVLESHMELEKPRGSLCELLLVANIMNDPGGKTIYHSRNKHEVRVFLMRTENSVGIDSASVTSPAHPGRVGHSRNWC